LPANYSELIETAQVSLSSELAAAVGFAGGESEKNYREAPGMAHAQSWSGPGAKANSEVFGSSVDIGHASSYSPASE
jgi:hypothetical protein